MEKGFIVTEDFVMPDYYPTESFEKLYTELRSKEQRIYTDEQVALLPDIAENHIHYNEWLIRKKSSERLVEYLKKKKRPLNILEVGCGNGWLSSKLADIENATVTGLDVNLPELKQGAFVFRNKSNLSFEYGDISYGAMEGRKFDIIIFAASIQYFPFFYYILNIACRLLTLNGEVHIIDSALYNEKSIATAEQRSKEYYERLGFPLMAEYYFHHSLSVLNQFDYKILYDPGSFINRLSGNKNPFYWLCVFNKI